MNYINHMRLGALVFTLVLFATVDFYLMPWWAAKPIDATYVDMKVSALISTAVGWIIRSHWSYTDAP